MPSKVQQTIPPFPEDVPTADIHTIDFDLLQDGDASEARKVYEASKGYGFFYLSNTHVDYDFMFDLANDTFTLPLDEKMKYEMGNTGRYFGYKMSGSNYVDSKGTPDKSEFYNISKDDVMGNGQYAEQPLEHPLTIERRKAELKEFMTSAHRVVLVVLKVLSEQLGLGPDVLPDLHKLDQVGGDQARVTHAPPVTADTITLGEHTGEHSSISADVIQADNIQTSAQSQSCSTNSAAFKSSTQTPGSTNTSNRNLAAQSSISEMLSSSSSVGDCIAVCIEWWVSFPDLHKPRSDPVSLTFVKALLASKHSSHATRSSTSRGPTGMSS
jgi:hypothetical protein